MTQSRIHSLSVHVRRSVLKELMLTNGKQVGLRRGVINDFILGEVEQVLKKIQQAYEVMKERKQLLEEYHQRTKGIGNRFVVKQMLPDKLRTDGQSFFNMSSEKIILVDAEGMRSDRHLEVEMTPNLQGLQKSNDDIFSPATAREDERKKVFGTPQFKPVITFNRKTKYLKLGGTKFPSTVILLFRTGGRNNQTCNGICHKGLGGIFASQGTI